ncbi:MAG: 30S ribosomal protein S8 [Candidatus Taylorbacteria bacterium]
MDPIANFITQIKNAGEAGKETVVLPYSKFKNAITDVLEKEGFIKAQAKKGKKINKSIEITLLYEGKTPKIRGVERVSMPSKRIYYGASELHSVKSGLGRLILSTSRGILSERQARKEKVGGEALFKIW